MLNTESAFLNVSRLSHALFARFSLPMFLAVALVIAFYPAPAFAAGDLVSVQVALSPASLALPAKGTQQFTATLSGTSNTSVTWSATAGSIDNNGFYTAPSVTAPTTVVVTAKSNADSSRSASVTLTVNPVKAEPLQPKTEAAQSQPTDTTAGYDGPAQLPIATVASSMADTPAPGAVIIVKAGGDLQTVLNNAQCGDTIQLQAGATFPGVFNFPAKSCDNNHWIIVRTSSPDNMLPPEGTRLTPCYAGVASLPGRPQYSCSHPQNVLAQLVISGKSSVGPVVFQSGANHYRLTGLEITRPVGGGQAPTLILVGQQGSGEYIVLDRSWVHGTTKDDAMTGFNLAGTNYVAVVDSYFSDFHCTSVTGICVDAHALSGGTGDHQDGPNLIQDNFLEASGEGILFGGGAATTTPTDITISFNHFFKPWQWMPGSRPFQGGISGDPFIVKNHFELKNASRVLAQANLMENNWGGFSQKGFAIVLTPKNQLALQPAVHDVCPSCEVTDVTIRYTHVIHAGSGIVLATSLSGNGGEVKGAAKAGSRWSLHDIVVDDINATAYNGTGRVFYVANTWPENVLNNVMLNHITAFPDSTLGLMVAGNQPGNQEMYGFTFTNSIVVTGRYPLWNAQGGGKGCAISDIPLTTLDKCFTTYTFNFNALLGADSNFPPSTWPKGNLFGPAPSNRTFVDFNNGSGGNYELPPGSPYINAGNDGKNLGADIAGLNQALAGVD